MRISIFTVALTAATALAGLAGIVPAHAATTGKPAAIAGFPASRTASVQVTTSSTPCFKASFPDCSSSDPTVSWGASSDGDTSGCEFEEDVNWGDGKTTDYTFPGGADGSQLATFTHQYTEAGTYSISATGQTTVGSCSSFDGTLSFTLLGTAKPPACTYIAGGKVPAYCIPANWDAHTVSSSLLQGKEPLNVIISAKSTVPFGTVLRAMSDWDRVTTGTPSTKPKGCMSEETTAVNGTRQAGQEESWRLSFKLLGRPLSGCDGGAIILAGLGVENHARIWAQPVSGSKVGGAWFVAASLERGCVIWVKNPTAQLRLPHLWHCIQPNGYNEGADQFVSDIIVAAHHHGWTVSTRLEPRALGTDGRGADHGAGTGLDGIAYSGNVEVVTVTEG